MAVEELTTTRRPESNRDNMYQQSFPRMMNTEPVYSVSIIGLGMQGQKTWVQSLINSSSITVSAVCDSNTEVIDCFRARFPRISAYTSLQELLENHQSDFAIVCVPNKHHLSIIQQLESSGVHCLKEKPIASSPQEFHRLCQSKAKIGVAFQRRWQPRFKHFRQLLPEIGKPVSVRATLIRQHDVPKDGWRVQHNVGIFDDLGVHMLDIMVWLFGRPSNVIAHRAYDGYCPDRDRESYVSMTWDPSDLVGHIHVSEVGIRMEETLVVRGSLGSLELSSKDLTQYDLKGRPISKTTFQSDRSGVVQTICKDFGKYVSGDASSFATSMAHTEDTFATTEAIRASFLSHSLEPVAKSTSLKTRVSLNQGIGEDTLANNDSEFINTEAGQITRVQEVALSQQTFLLNTGDRIPSMGFGTARPKELNQTYKLVRKALEVGYRHLDTASRYDNEDQVGAAVRDSGIPRQQVWVTTKVNNSSHHCVADAVTGSLSRLGLEYVDLLLMHWPSPTDPEDESKLLQNWDIAMTWQHMQKEVAKGRVRNIGVSNFGIRNLQSLLSDPKCTIVPAVNQLELHPMNPASGLVAFCNQKGIHCTAYSPLARGLRELHEHPVMDELCKQTGKTSRQILVMWGLQRRTSVVPKTLTLDRVAENCNLLENGLTAEQLNALNSIPERRRMYRDDWVPNQCFWDEDN